MNDIQGRRRGLLVGALAMGAAVCIDLPTDRSVRSVLLTPWSGRCRR